MEDTELVEMLQVDMDTVRRKGMGVGIESGEAGEAMKRDVEVSQVAFFRLGHGPTVSCGYRLTRCS